MNRAKKSQKLKEDIILVTTDLIRSQGYQKTTIRQIATKVGINTGSLYHFFKNKEDIFKRITTQTYSDFIKYTETVIKGNQDPLFRYAIVRAIEMKAVERHDRIAELYYASGNSWSIGQAVLPLNIEHKRRYFHQFNPAFTEADYYRRALALRGLRNIFISERYHTGPGNLDENIKLFIKSALSMFNVPKTLSKGLVSEILNIVHNNTFSLGGFDF